MLRRLTQDVGRFKAGVLHDWPLSTWMAVARDVGKTVDEISTAEEMNTVLATRNRGTDKLRGRNPGMGRASAGGKLPGRGSGAAAR